MTRAEYRARLRGRRCYVGMDLSSTTDLTAIVAVFPDDTGPGFDVLAQFFVPADNMAARVRRDRVPYDQWARDGWIVATPGNTIGYDYVRQALRAWGAEFDVREIAFDKWNAIDLVTRLHEEDRFACVQIDQTFGALSGPTKSLETAILSRALRHDGHPVLRWNLSNVTVEQDAMGNLKLSKKVSTEKIDGASALVNAIHRRDYMAAEKRPVYAMTVLG
jgi:phage terminase large subunit-like protein